MLSQDKQLSLKSGPQLEQIGDNSNNEAAQIQHRAQTSPDSHLPTNRVGFTVGTSAPVNDGATLFYRASKYDCDSRGLKARCCPNTPAHKVPRSIHEHARDLARSIAKTETYQTSRRLRKKIEMLFAHLKRILRLDRLRLRGPCGAHDEFVLAATAQNLRNLSKLIPAP